MPTPGDVLPADLIAAFESTYQPAFDTDVLETTGHVAKWREDIALLHALGVRRVRYPIRWHRVEAEPGSYDWSQTAEVLGVLADYGITPIVDLVHHTSYPAWLDGGFADARFGDTYRRYCEAFAQRFPDTTEYTLLNEPFSTLFLGGHEAIWPPYTRGMEAFVALLTNVLPAFTDVSRMYLDLLPRGQHVYTDTCERHTGEGTGGHARAALANDRRFFVLDAFLGRADATNPYVEQIVAAGGEDLLALSPGSVDVLGLDYYAHNQWHYFGDDGAQPLQPNPPPMAALIVEYAERYGLPCMLSETNIRGYAADRASWLKYTLEQYEAAGEAGIDLRGYCWFPFIDSCDWDSLLFRCDGNVDPVGVFWLDDELRRRPSSMSASYAMAAAGLPATQLPAYRFARPVSDWLAGYLPQMAAWDWRPAPPAELCSQNAAEDDRMELRIKDV